MKSSIQIFKKHLVFKVFVTGPADINKNPDNKRRCRVFHLEFSLKTKGSLEILSHYRINAYLVLEQRIRLETPGLPLFDRSERELTGTALDEAREKEELEFPGVGMHLHSSFELKPCVFDLLLYSATPIGLCFLQCRSLDFLVWEYLQLSF